MDYTELARQFLHNLYEFRSRGHQKRIDNTMHGEAFAMSYILSQGNTVLPSEISSAMSISSARVAAMLNNLEKKGLVTRRIDESDRRRILVSLTPEGIESVENRSSKVVGSTAKILESLGAHDAQELVRIVGRLADLTPQTSNDK